MPTTIDRATTAMPISSERRAVGERRRQQHGDDDRQARYRAVVGAEVAPEFAQGSRWRRDGAGNGERFSRQLCAPTLAAVAAALPPKGEQFAPRGGPAVLMLLGGSEG